MGAAGHVALRKEIATLYRADQAERTPHPAHGSAEYRALRERDVVRQKRVRAILATGGTLKPSTQYQAAMILQHSDALADIWQAHELTRASAEAGYAPARWLTAASLDRWLMYQGRPQKFGTQIAPDGKRQRVWDVEPSTSDEERARSDVPSLAQMQRRADELTRTETMPDMKDAPPWLKEAVRRWQAEGSW